MYSVPTFGVVVPPVLFTAELGKLLLIRVFFVCPFQILISGKVCNQNSGSKVLLHHAGDVIRVGLNGHGNLLKEQQQLFRRSLLANHISRSQPMSRLPPRIPRKNEERGSASWLTAS